MPTCWLLGLCFASLYIAGFTDARDTTDSTMNRPTYQFKYHVHDQKTMDYKTHEEVGENGLVHGSYTVREPNGDLRVVSYTAGDSGGFQAMVRVKPTFNPEAENSTHFVRFNGEVSKGSDTPLKIQLNTEPKSYLPQQRDQRHSMSAKFNTRKSIENNSKGVQVMGANLKSMDKQMKLIKTFPSTLHLPNLRNSTRVKMPTIKDHKFSANHRKAQPSKEKQKFSAAYVPLQMSSIQDKPQYEHFFAPLHLHVIPARFPGRSEAKFSPDPPKEDSLDESYKYITREETLCSAGQFNSYNNKKKTHTTDG
ncbi:Pupal cuticle protein Edg-84A [Frankliniella fusca]|uniref:Pupal cuticle protein Edg-84A n=1 Tax=Frankliniella fusca TaxID=407009 RepID=A0AAE1GYB5_9NEOP|nr:Pupal cuticle protein Edg-84A [Frankliniella fusca]